MERLRVRENALRVQKFLKSEANFVYICAFL